MPGGNPPKPPPSSFSAHRRNSGRDSSAHKPSAPSKSKPSPSTAAAAPPNNKPSTSKPKPRPENPSPRPEHPNAISAPRPPFPSNEPPPPPLPSYGFHMLERRSIVLADGSVRSYLALPPDYENVTHMHRPALRPELMARNEFRLERPPLPMSPGFLGPDVRTRNPEFWNSGPENLLKRKFSEDERGGRDDGFERQRQQLLQYGNVNGSGPSVGYNVGRGEEMRAYKNMRFVEGSSSKVKHGEVDQSALKKAFLHFIKFLFETANQRKKYSADGKQGPVTCLACGRSSKEFPDTHSLIMHAYTPEHSDTVVDHLGFHKALCVLMGWNYSTPPDNSKTYQYLSADRAEANRDDLIMWPPSVLIHNTFAGKGREGRMEGLGNKAMDSVIRDIGFISGKSMSLYSREGHLGIHMVKFSGDEPGLKEALRLSEYFERENRGRKGWARVQPLSLGNKDNELNPSLVRLNPKTGERERVFYGHLATVADLDKVTFEIKKRVSIVSASEFRNPN